MNFYEFYQLLKTEAAKDLMANFNKLADMPRVQVEALVKKNTNIWDRDRHEFTRKFSWSIPCKEAVDAIKKYARPPIYDPYAGSGYWARILTDRGVRVIASDIGITKKSNPYQHKARHAKVKRKHALRAGLDIQRAEKTQGYSGDTLIAWPPYECPIASDLLLQLPMGARVFYFGEGFMGCTGDAAFHKVLHINFKELDQVYLPQFEGIHDSLTIWEKHGNKPVNPKLRGQMGGFDFYDDDDD